MWYIFEFTLYRGQFV